MDGILKAELMSRGIAFHDVEGKYGGAGPSEGIKICLDGSVAHVPIASHYVKGSPFEAVPQNGGFELLRDGGKIAEFTIEHEPGFYGRTTESGIPLNRIAVICGESLASTVIQKCAMWEMDKACKFCAIELSLQAGRTEAIKSPGELAYAAKIAVEMDDIKQVTLTAGTTVPVDVGIMYLGECAGAIYDETGLPVHVQFQPPDNPSIFRHLKNCGVKTVGIHIESFDERVLTRIAPSKASLGIKRYEEAWEAAVRVFGRGKVQSFIIVGLGETPQNVIDGANKLAEKGVYPFVTPLRPIPGTKMQKMVPPPTDVMVEIYKAVADAMKKANLNYREFSAGCAACTACSALREFEE